MIPHPILDEIAEMDEGVVLFDGMEDALIGWTKPMNSSVLAVYDYHHLVACVIQNSGCTWEEAEEYVDFNVVGAHVGPGTPIVLMRPFGTDIKDFHALDASLI